MRRCVAHSRRVWTWKGRRSIWAALFSGHGRHIRMFVKSFRGMIVHVRLLGTVATSLRSLGLLLANTVNASAGIDMVVHRPVRALAAVCERTRDLLEAWVEGEVVANRVLVRFCLAYKACAKHKGDNGPSSHWARSENTETVGNGSERS